MMLCYTKNNNIYIGVFTYPFYFLSKYLKANRTIAMKAKIRIKKLILLTTTKLNNNFLKHLQKRNICFVIQLIIFLYTKIEIRS